MEIAGPEAEALRARLANERWREWSGTPRLRALLELIPRGGEAHTLNQSRIVGFVRHEETKEAIEGVTVRVYSLRFRGPLVTKTDSKGAYRFASLAPGVYVIRVQSGTEASMPTKWVDLDGALTFRADFRTDPPTTHDPDPPWRVRLESRRADPLRPISVWLSCFNFPRCARQRTWNRLLPRCPIR